MFPAKRASGGGSRVRRAALRLGLALAATLVALLGAEALFRIPGPQTLLVEGFELEVWRRDSDYHKRTFTIDPRMGYRPRLGTPEYGEFGTLPNDYPAEKRPGVPRLLFIGDSVTHQRVLERALRKRCGEEGVEYWNAGVQGFNTLQEVTWYLEWNRGIRPDHVILTFHNNDFIVTPVAFQNDAGEFTVVLPRRRLLGWSPWLLDRSRLYRLYLNWSLSRGPAHDPDAAAADTRAALARLRDAVAEDGARLSVLLLPILAPAAEWRAEERRSRELSLEIFRDLGLEWVDLLPPLESALDAGVSVRIEAGDTWHPSPEAADRFAAHLIREGLLEPTLGAGRCGSAPR